ncbi:thioredoxin domain-containing protein 11 [Leptopilina boulardi]|uniref:thioredoxin domain-containing protein 11 n=1 Tax=Leptopilina boulardi TaxID=63433 RepID=UPI0021F5B501|nr:thioredoxin domain-containing protein 11 [Leptopilina boulardi]
MMSGEEWDNVDDPDSTIQDSRSNNVAKKSNQSIASKMFSYVNSFFFVGIIFTILVALQSSPPKISKPPIARPFFNQSSIVTDFYKGHLNALIERIMDSDFSFIMYYAPWDAESQNLRAELETVSKYYHSQIFFAAINCWHPGSECRAQVNKIQSYPVLMLYPSRHSGIPYKGIRTAPYMIQFLDSVMKPIIRITDKIQLDNLLLEKDAVVLGFFNFTGVSKSPGYKEFYLAAVRSLERDPNQEIIYAAITDPKIAELNYSVVRFPHAKLFMWNESISYPENNKWTTDNLLIWSGKEMHRVTLWLQPPGSKSLTFAPYLWDGPVLFLFTPRNPLHKENYNYNLMKEIVLKYYNCADNIVANKLVKGLREKRLEASIRHHSKNKQCSKLLKDLNNQNSIPAVSVSIQNWINDTCCAQVVMNKCLLCKKKDFIEQVDESMCNIPLKEMNEVCFEKDIFTVSSKLPNHNEYELCCKKYNNKNIAKDVLISSDNLNENDPYSAVEIQKFFYKEQCRLLMIGNKYYRSIFPKNDKEEENINLTTSICEVNKTLSFIAVDSLYYFHFAEGLGVDISNRKDKTAVVILDPKEESQYVLKEELSLYSLTQFINNYTEGFLQRTLRSDKSRRFAHSYKKGTEFKIIKKSTIHVPELTTENFLETVLDSKKDVVVFYYSPYCGFCSAVAYTYLNVANYLSKMDHLILVRVDGDNNDLSWEYSMDRYPSILFFPAKRKEDSTVFPFTLPVTIANLLNFVLANLEGDSHVEALINICHIGAGESHKDCVIRIRWLCLDIIDDLLRQYRQLRRHDSSLLEKRIANKKWRLILLKLNHIKSVHLILESTDNLVKDIEKVKIIQNKFKHYYRILSQLNRNIKESNKTQIRIKRNFSKDEL